ncbi:MAG: RHS repeat-associated core domain-containing protein [Bacteroidales bacterium]
METINASGAMDNTTGFSYFGARYYDSDLSVWLSVDPLADKYPSMSPYMYCAGNPVVLFDSDGRKIKPVGESATKAMNYFGNKYGPLLQITTDQDKTSGTADDGVYYSRAYFSDRAAFDESFNKGLSDGTYTKKDREEAWTLYNVLVNPDIVEASVIIEGEGSRTYGHSDNEGSSYGGAALITDNSEYSEFVNVFNQKGGIMTKEMTDFLYNQTTVQTSDGVDHTIYPNASGNNWDFFRNGGYQKGQSGQTKGLVMINGTNLNIPAIAKVLLTAASKANSEQ